MKSLRLIPAIILITGLNIIHAQDTWTQKADFGGGNRCRAVGFSIEGKGYLGTGTSFDSIGSAFRDFWEYDPLKDTWTQKADFGGIGRSGAVGFCIGNKGYLGTGEGNDNTYLKDFWEYDPALNRWAQKADFGGMARCWSAAFSIGSKGYVGTGVVAASHMYARDFWQYDPAKDVWTKKSPYPGKPGSNATAFTIGDKGYMGMNFNCYDNMWWQRDFYEYDPATNTWTQKANFGGIRRDWTASFSIGSKGYVGTGTSYFHYLNSFWEYDPASDKWTRKAEFGGVERMGAIGFSIGNKGYIGTGEIVEAPYATSDFWEYTPDATIPYTPPVVKIKDAIVTDVELFPNPVAERFTLRLHIAEDTPSNSSYKTPSTTIYLVNNLGQVVYATEETSANGELSEGLLTVSKVITMPTTAASGWYVVRVVMHDQVIEQKLLYQK